VDQVGQAAERIRDSASEGIGIKPEDTKCSERSDRRGKRTSEGIGIEIEASQ
jgi:hypothetical protein